MTMPKLHGLVYAENPLPFLPSPLFPLQLASLPSSLPSSSSATSIPSAVAFSAPHSPSHTRLAQKRVVSSPLPCQCKSHRSSLPALFARIISLSPRNAQRNSPHSRYFVFTDPNRVKIKFSSLPLQGLHSIPSPIHPHQLVDRPDSTRKFSRRYLSSSSRCPPRSATSLASSSMPTDPTFQPKVHSSIKFSSQSLPRYPRLHPFPSPSCPPKYQLDPSTAARLGGPSPSAPQVGWEVPPTTKVCSFSTRKRSQIMGSHRQVSG